MSGGSAEAIVDAELDRVDGLSNVYIAVKETVLAEVEEIVLDLAGPVWRKRVFHAGADGPAPPRLRVRYKAAALALCRVLVVRPGAAALDVDERAVNGA